MSDPDTCMCGSPMRSHGYGDNHSPLSGVAWEAIQIVREGLADVLAWLRDRGREIDRA